MLASIGVFALVRSAPGDPIDIEFGPMVSVSGLSAADVAALRAERERQLGLDRPLAEQYGRWLARMVRGDLGVSYRNRQPVRDELVRHLPASVALGAAGVGVATVLATGLAVAASRRPGGWVDHTVRVASILGASVPSFLTGLLALSLLARSQGGYQIAGGATLGRLWLPALVLGVAAAPTPLRVLRSSLLAERGRLYAVAAVARGAGPSRLLLRHTGRVAVAPLLALAGMSMAGLVTGSIMTEAVFSWPGLGRLAVDAIGAQDYPVVQGYVLVVVVAVVVANALAGALQRRLDPTVDASALAVA
ncbi:MAG TPA: ABC transporter permease [Acidimicrobiales bacterium]|nr:ABC transporter permease [Acidimicrobiales bacterium]